MKTIAIRLLCALLAVSVVHAENWPQWRGPFFNGSTTETNLPAQWSKTENVAWVTPLPGYSGATPVIWQDSVFVSSPDSQKNLQLICLERNDGRVRWQKVIATGDHEKGRNNMSSPSPVTDGKSVFIMVGTGELVAFDFTGKPLWARNLAKEFGRFSINWLYGSSPMLYKGKLYVEVLQRNPSPSDYSDAIDQKTERESFLLCVDPTTGKNVWRQVRSTDATSEAQEAYTTPTPCEGPSGAEIIVVGGNYVTAHNADTGTEMWRCAGLNVRGEPFW